MVKKQASRAAESIAVRMDPRTVADSLIRETLYGEDRICERVVLCRLKPHATFGLSVVRAEDSGPFAQNQLDALSTMADTLLSLLDKHRQIVSARQSYNPVSLEQLPQIESVLQVSTPKLPRREAQVCARLICGRPMRAIAEELGVSPESVETYRKRAYLRLSVANKQELLLWYTGHL